MKLMQSRAYELLAESRCILDQYFVQRRAWLNCEAFTVLLHFVSGFGSIIFSAWFLLQVVFSHFGK
jgi:hypothetical protein